MRMLQHCFDVYRNDAPNARGGDQKQKGCWGLFKDVPLGFSSKVDEDFPRRSLES